MQGCVRTSVFVGSAASPPSVGTQQVCHPPFLPAFNDRTNTISHAIANVHARAMVQVGVRHTNKRATLCSRSVGRHVFCNATPLGKLYRVVNAVEKGGLHLTTLLPHHTCGIFPGFVPSLRSKLCNVGEVIRIQRLASSSFRKMSRDIFDAPFKETKVLLNT